MGTVFLLSNVSSVRLKDDGASSQLHTVKKNRQIDSVERKKKKKFGHF